MNLEFVIVRNPDIYLATTVPEDAETGGFALGPGVEEDQVRAGFDRLLSRADLSAISAITDRRAFGMWHLFAHTPLLDPPRQVVDIAQKLGGDYLLRSSARAKASIRDDEQVAAATQRMVEC